MADFRIGDPVTVNAERDSPIRYDGVVLPTRPAVFIRGLLNVMRVGDGSATDLSRDRLTPREVLLPDSEDDYLFLRQDFGNWLLSARSPGEAVALYREQVDQPFRAMYRRVVTGEEHKRHEPSPPVEGAGLVQVIVAHEPYEPSADFWAVQDEFMQRSHEQAAAFYAQRFPDKPPLDPPS